MSDDTLRRGFEALDAIGALRRDPPAPSASAGPVQEEPFSTYSFDFDTRHTDSYWCQVMAAWNQIAAHAYLPGAMRWAEKYHPDRYHRVTSELPAEWERLWDANAPLDEFQVALDRWVAAHEELIGLFPVSRGTE